MKVVVWTLMGSKHERVPAALRALGGSAGGWPLFLGAGRQKKPCPSSVPGNCPISSLSYPLKNVCVRGRRGFLELLDFCLVFCWRLRPSCLRRKKCKIPFGFFSPLISFLQTYKAALNFGLFSSIRWKAAGQNKMSSFFFGNMDYSGYVSLNKQTD